MAAEHQRSISRWSTATRSTGLSQQTIPLVNVRRKLFRTANPNQKLFQQRQTQTKQDIEQLFRLYYSNDLQFDTFQRQIVTGLFVETANRYFFSLLGKRIPTTPSTSTNNSTHQFSDPKLCVSREQLTPRENIRKRLFFVFHRSRKTNKGIPLVLAHNSKSATPIRPQKQRNTPMKAEIIDLTPRQTHPTVSQPVPESSVNDFCEPSLVKSVTFLDGGLTDSFDEMKSIGKPFQTRRPTSSKSSIYSGTIDAPHPSFLVDRSTNEINPRISSHKSSSTTTSVTLSRLPSRTNTHIRTTTVSNRQRIQSGTTVSTDLPSKPLSISTR